MARGVRRRIAILLLPFTAAGMTIIGPAVRFWKAEEYHQQYDEKSGKKSCPLPMRKST